MAIKKKTTTGRKGKLKAKRATRAAIAGKVTLKRLVQTSPDEAYRAFVAPVMLRDWLANAAQADHRDGGRLYLHWRNGYYACGTFTVTESPKKIGCTWLGHNEPGPSKVLVTFAPREGGTLVTLNHSGAGAGRGWKSARDHWEQLWADGLENLQSILETGIDLREARRPRLGIFIGDYNAEMATALGVPTAKGIRLEGALPGSGAANAGLKNNDVLIKFNRHTIANFDSLGDALQGLKAGDTVPVEFYRGGEKKVASLTLGGAPALQLPATAAELATTARKNYAALSEGLLKALDGLTNAQADYRTAPGEWSIKETIAHFIACERDLQSWTAELVNGGNNNGEAHDSLEYRPNVLPRLQALVRRFPTLSLLLDELAQAESETVDLIANLPPSFMQRKNLLARLSQWVSDVLPGHFTEEHLPGIVTAVQGAKAHQVSGG